MNNETTDRRITLHQLDDVTSEIVLCPDGVAGSTVLRADCGVLVHVDTWNSTQLNRLTVEHDEDGTWSESVKDFVRFLTGVEANDAYDFLRTSARRAAALPNTVSSLAVVKNQSLRLSPIYGLNALQIRPIHDDLFDIGDQLIDHGARALRDLARATDFAYLRELQTSLESYLGGRTGVTRAEFLESFLISSAPAPIGDHFIPPYPVPRELPTLDDDPAVEILEYDIDHDLVDRAWWTFSTDSEVIEVKATSQFADIEVFAHLHEKGSSARRIERVKLQMVGSSKDGSAMFSGRLPWNVALESRISIHESESSELRTRTTRVHALAQRKMAHVAAKLHAVGPSMSMDVLRASDPHLRADVEMVVSLLTWAVGDSNLSEECAHVLTARTTDELAGFGFVSTTPSMVESIRSLIAAQEEGSPSVPELYDGTNWLLMQELDRICERQEPTWGARPFAGSVKSAISSESTAFQPADTRIDSREIFPAAFALRLNLFESENRDRRWGLRSRRALFTPPTPTGLRWLRFLTEWSSPNKEEAATGSSSAPIVGSRSTTSTTMRTDRVDKEFLWQLKVAQTGL